MSVTKFIFCGGLFLALFSGCTSVPGTALTTASMAEGAYEQYKPALYNQIGGTSTNQSDIASMRTATHKNFCKVNPGNPSCK